MVYSLYLQDRVLKVSCPIWDQIHTSLKSIKWVTGKGNWKRLKSPRCTIFRAQSCSAVTSEVCHTAETRTELLN